MPKNIVRDCQCLMIETKDQRQFFTNEENKLQLLEFCKTFEMKMSIVKVSQAEILDIADLPKAFCNGAKVSDVKCELIRQITPFTPIDINIPLVRSRKEQVANAKKLRMSIRNKHTTGNVIRNSDLATEFQDFGMSATSIDVHHCTVREAMTLEGYVFERKGVGCYKASKIDVNPGHGNLFANLVGNNNLWNNIPMGMPTNWGNHLYKLENDYIPQHALDIKQDDMKTAWEEVLEKNETPTKETYTF